MGNSSNNKSRNGDISFSNHNRSPGSVCYRANCYSGYDLRCSNHNTYQTNARNIYCIVSLHYQANSTECHCIVLQHKNGMYDLVNTQVHNDISASNKLSMKEKLDLLIFIMNTYHQYQTIKSMI